MTTDSRPFDVDTDLARRLAQSGALQTSVLQRCLIEVRALQGRGGSVSLASYLAERGMVDPRLLQTGNPAPRPATGGGIIRLPTRINPGDTFCGFLIERELGRGGMGAVYLARDAATNARVALKVMLDPRKGDTQKERFRRECSALAALEHPGIVKLVRADTQGDLPCMAMEFVPGTDLEHALNEGTLTVDGRLTLLEQVCRAVHYAHQQGILHRDLKPANILVDEHGCAKVTDFGLVRDLSRETRLTASGTAMGTPGYMAPEQVRGKKDITHHCDIFSLGVILYESITGQQPFQGDTAVQVIAQIIKGTPESPSKLCKEAGPAHDAVISKALAKDPEQRYVSAEELADAIAGLRQGEAISARLGRVLKRLLVAVVLVAALVGGAVAWRSRGPGQLSPDELGARGGALRDRAKAVLAEQEAPLSQAADRVTALRTELDELEVRSAQAPGSLGSVAREIRLLEGLLALAEGDVSVARNALAAVGEGEETPGLRALRGGVAALTSEADASKAARDLEAAMRRGVTRPDLHLWRALALGLAGLPSSRDATQTLSHLDAWSAAHGALEPALEHLRVRAHLRAGQLGEADGLLARLKSAPASLRWEVALAAVEAQWGDQANTLTARLRALPAESPPNPRREELAKLVYAPAVRAVAGLKPGKIPAEVRDRILSLCRLGRALWPTASIPAEVKAEFLARCTATPGSFPDFTLAVELARLAPDDLAVQRKVGLLAIQGTKQREKRICLPALRRAIALETDGEKRTEQQRALVTILAYVNNRFEGNFNTEECQECLDVANVVIPRLDPTLPETAEVLHSRAIALRLLGDPRAAWRDINDAISVFGTMAAFRYTRMHIARALGKETEAFEDAVFYASVAEPSERTNRAMLFVWEKSRENGRDDLALSAVRHVLIGRRDYAGWWVRLASLQVKSGLLEAGNVSMENARREFEDPKLKEYRKVPEMRAAVQEVQKALIAGRPDAVERLGGLVEDLEARRKAGGFLLP